MGWKRHKKEQRKLKKLYKETKDAGWPSSVYYDERKERLVRYYRPRIIKQLSNLYNRRVRYETNFNLPNGSYYKHCKGNAHWEAY